MAAQLDTSNDGTLVYVRGPAYVGRCSPRTLVWIDRLGRETAFDTEAERPFGAVRWLSDIPMALSHY